MKHDKDIINVNNVKRIDIVPYIAGMFMIIAYSSGAAYIGRIINNLGTIQAALYAFSSVLLLATFFQRGKHLYREVYYIMAFFIYLIMITVYNDVSIRNVLNYIVPVFAFLLFAICMNYNELIKIMNIWGYVLMILVIIDLISIIRFPNGMYSTIHAKSIYTANWFLGYKTARIAYSLPALVFIAIGSISKNRGIEKTFYISSAIVLADTLMSYGTIASVGMVIFVVMVFILSFAGFNKIPRVLKILFDYRLFFGAILLLWITTVLLHDNTLIFDDIAAFFDKSYTLSGRTRIWDSCINAVKESNWLGIGIVNRETMEYLTGGMVNAHSQLLSILLHGGIPAVIMYVFLSISPMGIVKKYHIDYVMQLCIYTFYIIGLVSSTLTYSPIFFMLLVLIDRRREEILCTAQLNRD